MAAEPVSAGPGLRAEAMERMRAVLLASALPTTSTAVDRALTALLSLLAERGCKIIGPDATPDMLGAFWRTKNAGHCPQPAPVDTSDAAAFRAMLASAPDPLAKPDENAPDDFTTRRILAAKLEELRRANIKVDALRAALFGFIVTWIICLLWSIFRPG